MENDFNMIEENAGDLDLDYEARLAEIDRALEENARQMAEIENALSAMNERKIFTLEELKEMELKKKREERERLEHEKREIDSITAEALKKAETLRSSAKTENEKLVAEKEALNIELKAILHDLEIRKMILSENESKLESVLADFAIEESEYQKNKKASVNSNRKSDDYYKLRDEIYKIRSKKSSCLDRYKDISKIISKQVSKINEANNTLKSIHQKLYN